MQDSIYQGSPITFSMPARALAGMVPAVTVLEAIQRSSEFLTRKGVESPRLHVELLLAHVLDLPRLKLYLQFERVLQPDQMDRLRNLVQRRGNREPLQHILGSTSFCGHDILVGPDALIPRPETELLAEQGWLFLQHRAAAGTPPPSALDFGTGTGCLAVALALHCPSARLDALDISASALQLARRNAERLGVNDRIRFLQGDGFAALPGPCSYDLILSNPPYIASGDIASLQPEVRDFDPCLALDGGPDGLDFYRRLAAQAPPFLNRQGRLMVELGDDQAEPVSRLLLAQGWVAPILLKDYSGRERILIAELGGG